MRTIIWFAYFWGYVVLLIPKMIKFKKLKSKNEAEALEKIETTVTLWARRLIKLAGAQVSVTGLENIPQNTPVLFTGNHLGYFDIPLFLGYLDKTYPLVSKIEIAKIPLINRWMQLFDCVFLDRKNIRQSVAALGQAAELLNKGRSVSIFPEGTRSKTGELGDFKGGAFKIAEKARVPIVPCVITGTDNLMEKNHYFIRPAKISLTILPPIETKGLNKEEIKALPDLVKAQIAEQLHKKETEK